MERKKKKEEEEEEKEKVESVASIPVHSSLRFEERMYLGHCISLQYPFFFQFA